MVCIFGQGDCKKNTTISDWAKTNITINDTISTHLKDSASTKTAISSTQSVSFSHNTFKDCCPPPAPGVPLPNCPADLGGPACKDIDISQIATTRVKVVGQLDVDSFDTMKSALSTNISNSIGEAIEKADSSVVNQLAQVFGGGDKSSIKAHVTDSVTENIGKNFTQSVVNNILTSSVNTQNLNIVACGQLAANDCNFQQGDFQDFQIANITNTVANIIQSTESMTMIANNFKQFEKTKVTGIASAIAGIFKDLGLIGSIAVIGGIAVFLFIIILIIILLFGRRRRRRKAKVVAPAAAPPAAPIVQRQAPVYRAPPAVPRAPPAVPRAPPVAVAAPRAPVGVPRAPVGVPRARPTPRR